MPVSVSLKALVALPDSRTLWPEEFEALVKRCEEKPADRVGFGVVADWCDEHQEAEFAAAWRWLMNREGVEAYHGRAGSPGNYWALGGLPDSLKLPPPEPVPKTLAARVSVLADQLAKARAEIEKRKAELD